MGTCYKRYGKQGEWELAIKGMESKANGSLLSKAWQAGQVVLAIKDMASRVNGTRYQMYGKQGEWYLLSKALANGA